MVALVEHGGLVDRGSLTGYQCIDAATSIQIGVGLPSY